MNKTNDAIAFRCNVCIALEHICKDIAEFGNKRNENF